MDKKELLIKTGMKLFVKQGFENTPTSQISKESGVATGTLFYHFKTKEDLINEIYIQTKKSMSSVLLDKVTHNLDIKETIKQIWINLLSWGFNNKLENEFLTKFYGSVYINKLTKEEVSQNFKEGELLFKKAIKEEILKNISIELFERITMNLYQSFLPEFYKIKKLDENLLEQSFQIYFDAIKR